jgi:hypothetical protein
MWDDAPTFYSIVVTTRTIQLVNNESNIRYLGTREGSRLVCSFQSVVDTHSRSCRRKGISSAAHSLRGYSDLYMSIVGSLRFLSPQHRYLNQNFRLLAHEINREGA